MNKIKRSSLLQLSYQPNPTLSPRSFLLFPAVILHLRGAVSKQDIVDTKAPICTIMISAVTPKYI